ncbi:hypothetical protein ACLOJK_020591 [Asimina triloba]
MEEDFDLENPLIQPHPSDSIPSLLFSSESHHTPSHPYCLAFEASPANVSLRRDVLTSIFLLPRPRLSFDPLVAYLAVNYLDRFLSVHGLPTKGKPWIVKLLSVSCVSLALKMKKVVFSLSDIQGGEGFIFDRETIRRMELLILSALKWRMRSITPFAFLGYFLSFFERNDPPLKEAIKARAMEIVFKAQNENRDGFLRSFGLHAEIKLLEYKPSIIAASALLSAAHELSPLQFPCFRMAISSSMYINKEQLLDCCNLMNDLVIDGYGSICLDDEVSSRDTPVNVLDCHCLSSESEKTGDSNSTSSKRRKIGDFQTFHHISQIQHC